MRKYVLFSTLVCLFIIFFCQPVNAATFNNDNTTKGIVTINFTENISDTMIKVQVEKGTEKYIYSVIKTSINVPLQMGIGDYKISVLQNIKGTNKYKLINSETINVSSIDEKEMYKASIPMVEYNISIKAIPNFKSITEKKSYNDIITIVYDNIVNNYTYDKDKATKVQSGYVPIIDDVYDAKKGICYDYASLLAGALRSLNVPTRIVMGYTPEIAEYHAWNEILIDGKWIAVDSTYDAQLVIAGRKYTMAKDTSKAKIVKIY